MRSAGSIPGHAIAKSLDRPVQGSSALPIASRVWSKRDFRIQDHAPLARACVQGPIVPLWIVEPDWSTAPDTDRSHFRFALESALQLRRKLQTLGGELLVRIGSAIDILEDLSEQFSLPELLSHEETGNLWTFRRDQPLLPGFDEDIP